MKTMKNLMTIIATMVFAILISSNLFGQDLPIFKMDGSIQPNGLIEYNNDSCTVDYGNPTLNAALIHNVGDDFFTFSEFSQVNINLNTNINKTEFTIKANLNNYYYTQFFIRLYDNNNCYNVIHRYSYSSVDHIHKYKYFNSNFTNDVVDDYHNFIIKFKVINSSTLYYEISKENDTTVLNTIRYWINYNDVDFTKITKITLENLSDGGVMMKNFELYNKWLSNTDTKVESFENTPKLNSVKVYPNPTSNYFKIDNDVNYDVVNLYNTNGQLINSFEKNDRYNIENLPNGVYFIMLKDNSGVVGQQKILKN